MLSVWPLCLSHLQAELPPEEFAAWRQEQKDQLEEALGVLMTHLDELKSDPDFALSLEEHDAK